MVGSQDQRRQPWIPSFGFVTDVHIEVAFRVGHMLRNYSEVKGSLVEEPIIHIVLFLEKTLHTDE